MPVRFIKSYGRYSVNDIAGGFSPAYQAFLLEQGYAELVEVKAVDTAGATEGATMPAATTPGGPKDKADDDPKKKDKDDKPLGPQTRQTTVGPQSRR